MSEHGNLQSLTDQEAGIMQGLITKTTDIIGHMATRQVRALESLDGDALYNGTEEYTSNKAKHIELLTRSTRLVLRPATGRIETLSIPCHVRSIYTEVWKQQHRKLLRLVGGDDNQAVIRVSISPEQGDSVDVLASTKGWSAVAGSSKASINYGAEFPSPAEFTTPQSLRVGYARAALNSLAAATVVSCGVESATGTQYDAERQVVRGLMRQWHQAVDLQSGLLTPRLRPYISLE